MIYTITKSANAWIAQRDSILRGQTQKTIAAFPTLRDAQKRLLDFYNEDYPAETNWGMAVCHNPYYAWSQSNGLRGYEYDSRYYRIEEIDIPNMLWDYYVGGHTTPTDILSIMNIDEDNSRAWQIFADLNTDMLSATDVCEKDKIVALYEEELRKLI